MRRRFENDRFMRRNNARRCVFSSSGIAIDAKCGKDRGHGVVPRRGSDVCRSVRFQIVQVVLFDERSIELTRNFSRSGIGRCFEEDFFQRRVLVFGFECLFHFINRSEEFLTP